MAVGAGQEDPTAELEFTTENTHGVGQQALPTLIGVLTAGGVPDFGEFDRRMLLHAEQAFILHKPLPVAGTLTASTEVKEVWDKGSGALIVVQGDYTDDSGMPIATVRSSVFIRAAGGFGGEVQPSASGTMPDGPPDHQVLYRTSPNQALLYRLTGDRNPLHSDPAFAASAGFGRPILHGMCTYGFAGRALLHAVADGQASEVESMSARFTSVVMPGDTLTTAIWTTGKTSRFQTKKQDGTVVLDRGVFTVH